MPMHLQSGGPHAIRRAMDTPRRNRTWNMGTARRLLARLRDIMAESVDPEHRLENIARLIAAEMAADVCSCYVLRAGDILELFATVGLKRSAIHQTRLRVGEGIVGTVAAHTRPVAVEDCQNHPSFAYRPETGEDPFKSLLGVPILRAGRVRGVLVIQHRESRPYQEEEIETLETIAMVVAELVASGALLGQEETARIGDSPFLPPRLTGVALSGGVGIGLAVLHAPQLTLRTMVADDPDAELERLSDALGRMHSAIDALMDGPVARAGAGEPRDIMESYRMIAEDRGWLARIREAIWTGLTAEAAILRVLNETRSRTQHVTDAYIRERLQDIDDLGYRLLQHLSGASPAPSAMPLPDDVVLVARSLGPADLLEYDQSRLRGVVLVEGSPTSHVAIVARALGIPVVGKIPDILDRIDPLDLLIVDGDHNYVFVRPNDNIRNAYVETKRLAAQRNEQYAALLGHPSISADGVRIAVHLNCGLLIDVKTLGDNGADGIGLFRTEIPFMVQSTYPDVAMQTELYANILELAGDRPVVFRTLDVGGDKRLPYFATDEESNPALGWRAIRIGLDRPAILCQQLRALLRAANGRPLSVMFPMVSDVQEFERARRLMDRELERAARAGLRLPSTLKVGTMLEVPSLMFQLPALVPQVDFLSIGSNDLTQYLFATDRANPRLSRRYDPLSPAMFEVLMAVLSAAERFGKPVTLCGEMAGNPVDALALIGLGFRTLSMAPPSVPGIKAMIRKLPVTETTRFVTSLRGRRERSFRESLRAFARDHGVPI